VIDTPLYITLLEARRKDPTPLSVNGSRVRTALTTYGITRGALSDSFLQNLCRTVEYAVAEEDLEKILDLIRKTLAPVLDKLFPKWSALREERTITIYLDEQAEVVIDGNLLSK
jgi:hypothetical protein